MKITKSMLKQLIKEELDEAVRIPRQRYEYPKAIRHLVPVPRRSMKDAQRLKDAHAARLAAAAQKKAPGASTMPVGHDHPGETWADISDEGPPGWEPPDADPRPEPPKKDKMGVHGQDVSPYQALGDAALRGSEKALKKLQSAAGTDPSAQAILDAVYKEKPGLKPKLKRPGLSAADLDAAQLQENRLRITKQRLKRLIKEELTKVLMEIDSNNDGDLDPEELRALAGQLEQGEAEGEAVSSELAKSVAFSVAGRLASAGRSRQSQPDQLYQGKIVVQKRRPFFVHISISEHGWYTSPKGGLGKVTLWQDNTTKVPAGKVESILWDDLRKDPPRYFERDWTKPQMPRFSTMALPDMPANAGPDEYYEFKFYPSGFEGYRFQGYVVTEW